MGGGGTNTTTQNADPWSGQQPYLQDIFRQAQSLYGGGGPQYFPEATYVPFSPQTQMGLDMTTARALGGSPYESGMSNYLTSAFGQPQIDIGGYASAMDPYLSSIGAGQSGLTSFVPGASGYGAGSGESPGPPGAPGAFTGDVMGNLPTIGGSIDQFLNRMEGMPGTSQLNATASGNFLGSNPYLDQVYDTAAGRMTESFNEQVLPGIAGMFGSAGRSGSGLQGQVVSDAAGELSESLQGLAGDIYAPAYEAERNRMVNAAGTAGGQALQGMGYGSGLYGSDWDRAAGLYSGDMSRGLDASRNLSQFGLGGMGALTDIYGNISTDMGRAGALTPAMYSMDYGNLDRLMGVGGAIEGQAGEVLGDAMNRWNHEQNLPWQMLGNYANTVYGLPGGYGTTTTSQPAGSPLQGAIGGAMAGAAIPGMLGPGGMGLMAANPAMWPFLLGGGLLGALG